MKWEPVLAMVALLFLGVWLVYGPSIRHEDIREGARLSRFVVAGVKGELEVVGGGASGVPPTFRLLYRDGTASSVKSAEEFGGFFGPAALDAAVQDAGNVVFRVLNVTGWGQMAWVAVGFLGQGLFFGRMLVQWVVSEKQKQSVVPEAFWWLSLGGGVALFAYFVWRQDLVGVVGQTSGVVIYARNIRLIIKQRRRAERRAARAAEGGAGDGSPV